MSSDFLDSAMEEIELEPDQEAALQKTMVALGKIGKVLDEHMEDIKTIPTDKLQTIAAASLCYIIDALACIHIQALLPSDTTIVAAKNVIDIFLGRLRESMLDAHTEVRQEDVKH